MFNQTVEICTGYFWRIGAVLMNTETQKIEVVVTDLDIPFGRMIGLLTKLILAAIPAVILAAIIGYGILLLLSLFGVSVSDI